MGFPYSFLSLSNFQLAFKRVAQGQNQEYKSWSRHLYSSYYLSLKDNLEDLIDDIKTGRYKPSVATCVYQPKKSGILRPIRLLSLQDQIVYQALTNVIAKAFYPLQKKFAFKRCFGAIFTGGSNPFFYHNWKSCFKKYENTIIKTFKEGKKYVADFDLVSFYELIDHNLLNRVLGAQVDNKEILNLLEQCLQKWTENNTGACLHHGIPQGPEASAFLAECFLFGFDRILFGNVTYLRYVDDIKLMGRDEAQVKRGLLKLDILSKQYGLVPQAQKIECRQISSIKELRNSISSSLATIQTHLLVNPSTHKRLERMFSRSMSKNNGVWTITDERSFKFSIGRLNRRKRILDRLVPFIHRRHDLAWLFSNYLYKFPLNKHAASIALMALNRDPIYDASAARYIDALDVCIPHNSGIQYRKTLHEVRKRSEEDGIALSIAISYFLGRRSSISAVTRLIEKQSNPIAKCLIIDKLFGSENKTPFKISQALPLIIAETESSNPDLARFCAGLLIDIWPWTHGSWKPSKKVNRAVKLLLKGLGLREKKPKKESVIGIFFHEQMKIGVKLSWNTMLGRDLRTAEVRCLKLQEAWMHDPTKWVMTLDTFNEVLISSFSKQHPALRAAYSKAIPPGRHHPDFGAWLNQRDLARVVPKCAAWLLDIHNARSESYLAHARSRKGKVTKEITYKKRDDLHKRSQSAWAELILEWKKI